MSNLFNPNNKVMVVLGHVADYMILSVLWFVFSIPIFTIGASTTALFYASMKLLSGESTYVSKDFWHSFKQNFKQATLLWLLFLVLGVFCVVDIYFYVNQTSSIATVALLIFVGFTILYLFTLLYLFPYLSKFYCTFKRAILNSLYLSVRHFGYTILMIVIDVAIVLASLYYTFLILFLPGLLSFANSIFFNIIFKRYIPKEDAEQEEDPDAFATIEEIEARDAAMAAATEAAATEDSADESEP